MREAGARDRIVARFRTGFPFVVSIAVFAWLLARDDIAVRGVVLSVPAGALVWIGSALLVYGVVSLLIEAFCLVRIVGLPLERFGLWTAARIKAASYLAYVIHYGVGVGALSVLLRRTARLSLADSAGVVLLIAAFDLGITLGVATIGALILGGQSQVLSVGVVAAAAAVVGGFVLLRAPVSLGRLERVRSLSFFRATREASPSRLIELLAARALFVLCFFALAIVSLRAFEIRAPLGELLVNVSLVVLVSALPIAVAGLGTVQATFVYLFRAHGDPETLFGCSILLWAGIMSVRAITGALFAREYVRDALHVAREEGASSEARPVR